MGGDKNVRLVLPASSVKDANFWQRMRTSCARFVLSVVCIEFEFCGECASFGSSGFAYNLRCRPAKQNQADENFPTIPVPVGRDGKVIADHDKDNGNGHESIVFGT
jgi:hypothetical protein